MTNRFKVYMTNVFIPLQNVIAIYDTYDKYSKFLTKLFCDIHSSTTKERNVLIIYLVSE